MLIFLFLTLTKCNTFPKYNFLKQVLICKGVQKLSGRIKIRENYYGKLQVDETSDKIKSNQKLTVIMEETRLRTIPQMCFIKRCSESPVIGFYFDL